MEDQLSKTFQALAEPFDLSLQAISKHVKALEAAGLIQKDKQAQLRTSTIKGAPLKSAADWLLGCSSFVEDTLDRLDEHLKKGSSL